MGIKILVLVSIGLSCCAATGTFAKIRNEKDDLFTWGKFDRLNSWLEDHSNTSDPADNLAIINEGIVAMREEEETINKTDDKYHTKFREHKELEEAADMLIKVANIKECDDEKLQLIRVVVPGFSIFEPWINYDGSREKRDILLEHYVRIAVKKCEQYIVENFYKLDEIWKRENIDLNLTGIYPPRSEHEEWIDHLYNQRVNQFRAARDTRFATIEAAVKLYNDNDRDNMRHVFNVSFVKPCQQYIPIMEDLVDTVYELKDLATVGYDHRKDFFKRIPVEFQNGLHQYIICSWYLQTINEYWQYFWVADPVYYPPESASNAPNQ